MERFGHNLKLAALALCLAAPAAGAETAGEVVALRGEARATNANGDSRALVCGDRLASGEQVELAEGARLGVLSDAVYAQLDGGASSRIDLLEAGTPSWTLAEGRMRLVDTRETATAPVRLATPHAAARGTGSDSEAYVLSEKTGEYSIVCEWGAPLEVARGNESLTAAPGACAVAKPSERLYDARAHADRIPLAGADACPVRPLGADLAALLGPPGSRFAPGDVAAGPPPGPPLPVGPGPPAPPAFERQPCEGGCFVGGVVLEPLPPVESPVTPGTLPGL